MNIKELSLFLSYATRNDRYPPKCIFLNNLYQSLLIIVPIVNTIFGITMLVAMKMQEKKGLLISNQTRTPRIILMSFCIGSLGILLLPLMINGTLLKKNAPTFSNRKIREIPSDYLL